MKHTTLSRPAQQRHIAEHLNKFWEATGSGRSVSDYFQEYAQVYEQDGGYGALYVCLCSDMGIAPKGQRKRKV